MTTHPHLFKSYPIITALIFIIISKNVTSNILIAGSANLDTFLPLSRLPTSGENLGLLPNSNPIIDVPGGKGCNQAIACSKLSKPKSSASIYFLSRLGDIHLDKSTTKLIQALEESNVNTKFCLHCQGMDCGRGYVFLEKNTGKVSAVVSGGSNLYGWKDWEEEDDEYLNQQQNIHILFQSTKPKCLLLQREIPEIVNHRLAKYVADNKCQEDTNNLSTIVLQDVGGEDRPMSKEMLSLCDYIMPNESELLRLVKSLLTSEEWEALKDDLNHDNDDISYITKLVSVLQQNGANHVLVTLGEKGSILVMKLGSKEGEEKDRFIHFQKACILMDEAVVDETGAGDCYRAAFAVGLSEGRSIEECMEFASAAGALAVTKEGAVPSIPTREEVDNLITKNRELEEHITSLAVPRGGGGESEKEETASKSNSYHDFPFMFGSRLNSMKDRPELWPNAVDNIREWVKRQNTVKGLGCVDFNWPQHFQSWNPEEAKAALDEEGLVAGAVCLRYPSKFARGAMIHPDASLRREAIELTKEAAEVARKLGCNEVVVWSAYDGYDYPFQVNYKEKWNQLVEAFQECCDAYPDIKWSLEYKPTDENTRFFTVPSTGAAMLLLKDIDRANMGLTLDVGHMLMAGENPGQSISMVGEKLFGIQLNDGYTRLAAEDGMMFASVHPTIALEIIYQLQEINFSGHLYFDTFPQRTDPVKECEYNINKVKQLWGVAKKLNERGIKDIMNNHDAVGVLNLLNLKFDI